MAADDEAVAVRVVDIDVDVLLAMAGKRFNSRVMDHVDQSSFGLRPEEKKKEQKGINH